MSNLPTSFLHVLDGDGNVYAGALLYTYAGGTTTPLATYSDRALTSANANPVVADSNGRFGEIYLTPDTAYKLVLKTSAGVTVWTDDDVYALQLSSGSITERILQGFASPLDYPDGDTYAVGDGAEDESTQVQNAIDASDGVVDLLGLTFRCDSALTLKSGLTLRNGTLVFSDCEDNSYLYGAGSLGDADLLAASASRGDKTLTATSGSGIAAGDWLLLYGDGTWDGTDKQGELVQVHSIAGAAITLRGPIEGSYTTGNNSAVKKLTTITGLRLDNVRVVMSTAAAGSGIGLFLWYAEDAEITGCRFEGAKQRGALAWTSVGVRVRGCTFEEATSGGVQFSLGCRDCSVSDSDLRRITNGDAVYVGEDDYTNINISMINCRVDSCLSGGQFGNSRFLKLIGNSILCDTNGASSAGTGFYLHNCVDFVVGSNTFRECGGIGVLVESSGISCTDGAPFTGVVENNHIRSCDDDGIDVYDSPNTVVRGNTVVACGGVGIRGQDCDNLTIDGNIIEDAGEHGIHVRNSAASISGTAITNNTIEDPGDSGIVVQADNSLNVILTAIMGNRVYDVDSAADYCILLTTSAGATITQVVISSNILERDDDLDDNIQLDGGAAANITSVIVVGNHMVNGDYAIGEPTDANNTNVVVGFNLTNGMAQGGTYEGTLSNAVAANDHNTDI